MCSASNRHDRPRRAQHGVTLVEVIVFIVIVSIALSAIVTLLARTAQSSADPLVLRQNLAIGEALIQEIDTVPYHQKNPYDPTGPDDAIGPEAGETRGGNLLPYDNPNDYAGYSETGIVTPDGTAVANLNPYSASVAAAQQSMGSGTYTVPAGDGLLVTTTVTGPNGEAVTLTSFRAMYAP
jgi:MSHA pilin protein MshD